MIRYIKNTSGSNSTYLGQQISNNAYYQIQDIELTAWQWDSTLLSDIGSGDVVVARANDGSDDITDVAGGISFLQNGLAQEVHVSGQPPFTDKVIGSKSLFNRTTGKSFSLSAGSNTCEFAIPYNQVKFSGIEIINGELGDTVDLKILDDASGTYSTIPNYQFNQFGYDVNLSATMYVRESQYDADLYVDMRIVMEIESVSAKTLRVNYIIHELK